MKKTVTILFLTAILGMAFAPAAFAAEEGGAVTEKLAIAIAIAAGFGLSLAVMAGAVSQGMAIRAAMDGIARNPGASGKIMTPMIIGLAMIESLVIYSLVISLILVFKI